MSKPKLTIIDTSSLIYSASYNTSKKEGSESDLFSNYTNTLDYYINSILDETNAEHYILFGDEPTSYRKRIFSTFKADRVKPYMKFKYDLMQYAKTHWEMYTHKDLEADDLCLICNNYFKDKYEVIIAAKDSDLPQEEGVFFNYGILGKSDYSKDKAFSYITKDEAEFRLYKQVLSKGHNNKVDYLEGCGDKCSTNYLKSWTPQQYKYATLKAFIEGIDRNKDKDINRNITGYGLNKGIDKFNKSFKQSYLFRNLEEIKELDIEFDPTMLTIYKREEDEATF